MNHPNILGLYDIGTEGGIPYIITELVPGETLGSLIGRGPVGTRKLLDIAVQIADGMAAAHAAGITHRDLKPSNIMLSPDGRVKILDFGLARQRKVAETSGSKTVTLPQTEPGMIVGTVNYMSPEQARGNPVDQRSDQFSFGLILYEMASGKKAFDKPESVQTMSAILTEEPPPIERPIPGPLRWTIDRCLAKDPADRYDSSRDLYQELRNLRDHLSEASAPQAAAQAATTTSRRMKWPLLAIGLLLGSALTLGAWLYFEPPPMPDQSAYRFTPFAFDPGGQSGGSWSPDGKAFAYQGGNIQVFIRYLDSSAPVQVTHIPEGAFFGGVWSADSRRIYFASARNPAGIWSIAAVGGDPEPSLSSSLLGTFSAIDVSPDWKAMAALRLGEDGRWGIWIGTPPKWEFKKYSPDPFASTSFVNAPCLHFAPDGKNILLFFCPGGSGRGEEAWLIPYPPDPRNPPRLVLRDLPRYGGTPSFSWMPDSRRIVFSTQATPEGSHQLWLADVLSGTRQALTSGTSNRGAPAVSPDGQRIIFTEQSTNFDVVSANLDGFPARELIATERNETMPAWAAKEPALVYVTDRNGPPEIWLRAGGSDRPLVTARSFPQGTTQWFMAPALSPNADRVVYTRIDRNGTARLWISAISGGSPTPLTDETAEMEYPGSWSPDASWFVYSANRNGKSNLMKVKTIGQATPSVLKSDLGLYAIPSWSPAGDWIAYGEELISPDGKTTRAIGNNGSGHYMFSSDGKLVYGIRRGGKPNVPRILFSVDIAKGTEKVLGDLGKDFYPSTHLNPGIRFSLAPDGKSFIYGIIKSKSNLWMLEGFEPKADLLSRFLRR